MNYITTTQLRTDTPELLSTLQAGKTTHLLHRSKVVAVITPINQSAPKIFDGEKYLEETKGMVTKKYTQEQRDKNYHNYLMGKYGKNIS